MRARLNDLVLERLAAGSAVPAFTCYDFTTALAVVSAAEDARLPVILLVAPKTAAGPGGLRFIRALRGLADDAGVPVVVQLDHATDPGLIQAAVTAGADAVLADGSRMPPVRNAEFVASIASLTSGSGVVIEAELGALGGDEDDSRGAAKHDPAAGMTDPAAVAAFLDASAADLLAVAVGNVHGNYSGEPKLDWERISRIRTAAGAVPLVLHGASGLSSADLERAASAGIGKVNVNTELRTATLEAVAAALPEAMSSGANMLSLMQAWSRAAGSTAGQTLKLLNAAG
jgi:tagatose 1,6-diphosphate aldolase GatY/KbaY